MDSTKVNPSRKLPGERIAAREWNAVVDSFARLDVSSEPGGVAQSGDFNADVVLVANTTGRDLARFSPIGITISSTPVFNPTTAAAIPAYQAHRGMSAGVPQIAHSDGRLGVTLDAIGSNKYGRAIFSGVVPCKIDMVAAGHQFATAKASNTDELVSVQHGPFYILWRETGTGTRWAIVRLGHIQTVLFPVLVTPTAGGTYGSNSTACNKTYDVTDLNYVSLGTAKTPKRPRPQPGEIKIVGDGAVGIAYYDENRNIVLYDAGEVPNRYPSHDT